MTPCPDVRVRLQSAGHILGSASAFVEAPGGASWSAATSAARPTRCWRRRLPPPACDAIVVESTYGDRAHAGDDLATLADVVTRTIDRGGTVVIPSFAVDRTEVVLVALRRLAEQGRIPRVPVYVDSPMALSALAVYRRALAEGDPELRPGLGGPEVFDAGDLHEVRSAQESRALDPPPQPSVIISASGMATGGRVVHHLKQLLPDRRNAVVLVGYQAEGTRGRDLIEGARQLKMHGHYVAVRAEVVALHTFSVHADADEIVELAARRPRAARGRLRRARRAARARRRSRSGCATSWAGSRWCRGTASSVHV